MLLSTKNVEDKIRYENILQKDQLNSFQIRERYSGQYGSQSSSYSGDYIDAIFDGFKKIHSIIVDICRRCNL